jgi:phenylacetate-CoA ligase
MFDRSIHLEQFELVQRRSDVIEARFVPGAGMENAKLVKSVGHLQDLIALCFEHPVEVKMAVAESFPARKGKKRPIRCELEA